jgi:hypothetical protein
MPGWVDLIIVAVLLVIVAIWIVTLRKRLLRLWTEVTQHEIRFYRQLEHVVRLFYAELQHLGTDDNRECVKMVRRYRKKRLRSLLLSTRQELFNAIQVLYDEIEERDDDVSKTLQVEFDALQKVRRLYNSRVLIYNQTINVFPTRYLALRMNLEQKEYFG